MSRSTSGRIRPLASTRTHRMSAARQPRVVVLDRVPRHVLQLGERLDARVAAAHEGEGQRAGAHRRVVGGAGGVQPGEDVVAQVDRLADGLEADAVLGEAGDRQRPGDRAGGHHQDVVGRARTASPRPARCAPACSACVSPVTAPVITRQRLQRRAQRHHHVPRLHRAGRRLGQEGLVGHVRLRVDDHDLRPPPGQLLLQSQRGVEADVPAAHDQDHRTLRHGGKPRPRGRELAPAPRELRAPAPGRRRASARSAGR